MEAVELKKKTKGNKREALIRAAMKLFAEKGYHAVSTKELSEKAKANVSLISFYFGSKQGLLLALFQKIAHHKMFHMEKLFGKKLQSQEDLRYRVETFLTEFTFFFLKNSELINVFLNELELENSEAKALFPLTFGSMYQQFMNFLQRAKDDGYLPPDTDIEVLSLRTIAPFTGLMRSCKSSAQNFNISLEDPDFRRRLITHITEDVAFKNLHRSTNGAAEV